MTLLRSGLLLLAPAMLLALAPARADDAAPPPAPPAAAAPVGAAGPQPEPPRKVSKGERQALEWFHMLDSDGDGRISLGEARIGFLIKPSLRQLFEDADSDGDRYLTQDEIRAAAARRRAERQRRRAAEAAAAAERARAARPDPEGGR